MKRQSFSLLPLLTQLVLLILVFSSDDCPAQSRVTVQTFTYKRVGELKIALDVHRVDDDRIRPLAVWIHGGALINGGRQGIGPARRLLDAGYVIVSIDYRLAPETKLPGIVADVEDAFAWIRKHGREKFHADTSRIAVLGGSAGGHLTLTSGFRIDPPPTVLVSYWGYGDLVGPWLSEPSPHARHRRKTLDPEQMAALEAGPPVANASNREGDGSAYYQTCRLKGVWPEKVAGFPETAINRYKPFMAAQNVTPHYPPTLLIHGTKDTDVPFEQSVIMQRKFEEHGVEHRLIAVDGGEHGLRGANPDAISAAHRAMLPFVQKYMSPDAR